MLSVHQQVQHLWCAARSASVRVFEDTVAWFVVFFLLGAPVLPMSRAGITLVSALAVALTWPLTISAWAALLATSLQRDRQKQPIMSTAVDLFTAPFSVPSHDARLEPAVNERCGVDARMEDVLAVKKADNELSVPGYASVEAAQLTRCFVLAAVLLGGGLFGQLDWQIAYQVWPYPSLSAYVVARLAFEAYDRVRGGGGALHK
ncbi:hypothetical protein IOCL2690_000722700 [Leishmania lindenbergi]|uniref:Uncharacterized protein n=1 Tax=Leishmania lindenbergi TaxID=651832 RepID=A0AAW3A060_9TRYP